MGFFVFFFALTCVTAFRSYTCAPQGHSCGPSTEDTDLPGNCCSGSTCGTTCMGHGCGWICLSNAEGAVGVRKEDTVGLPSTSGSLEEGSHTSALESARTLEVTRALAAKANMQTEAIGTGYNLGEIAIMALAVVGSITVFVNAFTACTPKEEYKAVLGDKNVEQLEEI